MALIVWSGRYSVGVNTLDDDHIVIASLINHIDDAKQFGSDEAAVGSILKVLVDHAHAHFRHEETLLEDHGYPELERHKREHRLLEEQLAELHQGYVRTHDPNISQEIVELLNFWLVEHLLKVDMRYKAFLERAMM